MTPSRLNTYRLTVLLMALLLLLPAPTAWAQKTALEDIPLIVGVTELPPFSIKTDTGAWSGLGIDLWRMAAEEMETEFEIREFDRLKQISEALANNEIDISCMLPVTEHNETVMDLSHAYHRTGLDIVVGSANRGIKWFDYVRQISYGSIVAVIGMLILMSLVAGTIIWFLEKKHNPEMFGGPSGSGLGHGLWWALVTMTTVGYGDKAPRTAAGRSVAVAWMFLSVSCIAWYTAVITSSLTVSELSGKIRGPRDLPHVRVGALARSETMDILVSKGISAMPFKDLQAGLQAVYGNQIDAFVDNEAQLTYLVKTHFPGRLQVLGKTFEHYYVSMGVPAGSPLREPLNRAIAKLIDQEEWNQLKMRYMGRVE